MVGTQITRDQGRELVSNPGFVLEANAAKAWDRAVKAFGKDVLLTGAWRSRQTQVELFDSELYPRTGRYVRGNHAGQRGYTTDVRGRTADGGLYRGSWWTRKAGTAAAAVPGTSNHGSGRAVDVKTSRSKGDPGYATAVVFTSFGDADRLRFLRVAAEHGWDDDEGRGVSEHWHLTYYPERDQHRGETVPAKPKPQPKPGTRAFVVGRVKRIQGAIGAEKDGVWGGDTDRRLGALETASRYGRFPFGKKFVQDVVGVDQDGVWGNRSEAALVAAVKRIQDVLGIKDDGRYGPKTDAALAALEKQAKG